MQTNNIGILILQELRKEYPSSSGTKLNDFLTALNLPLIQIKTVLDSLERNDFINSSQGVFQLMNIIHNNVRQDLSNTIITSYLTEKGYDFLLKAEQLELQKTKEFQQKFFTLIGEDFTNVKNIYQQLNVQYSESGFHSIEFGLDDKIETRNARWGGDPEFEVKRKPKPFQQQNIFNAPVGNFIQDSSLNNSPVTSTNIGSNSEETDNSINQVQLPLEKIKSPLDKLKGFVFTIMTGLIIAYLVYHFGWN